jgi:hypothetical protein
MIDFARSIVPFALACAGLMGCRSDAPPDVVTRQYLEAGSRGDLNAARKLVVPRCRDKAEGRLEAIQFEGVPIKIEKLQIHITTSSDTAATVRYEIAGSAKGRGGSDAIAAKGGDLRLEKVDGVWLVSCE